MKHAKAHNAAAITRLTLGRKCFEEAGSSVSVAEKWQWHHVELKFWHGDAKCRNVIMSHDGIMYVLISENKLSITRRRHQEGAPRKLINAFLPLLLGFWRRVISGDGRRYGR